MFKSKQKQKIAQKEPIPSTKGILSMLDNVLSYNKRTKPSESTGSLISSITDDMQPNNKADLLKSRLMQSPKLIYKAITRTLTNTKPTTTLTQQLDTTSCGSLFETNRLDDIRSTSILNSLMASYSNHELTQQENESHAKLKNFSSIDAGSYNNYAVFVQEDDENEHNETFMVHNEEKYGDEEEEEDELPYGWSMYLTSTGKKYYVNHIEQTSQWLHPSKCKKRKMISEENRRSKLLQIDEYNDGDIFSKKSNELQFISDNQSEVSNNNQTFSYYKNSNNNESLHTENSKNSNGSNNLLTSRPESPTLTEEDLVLHDLMLQRLYKSELLELVLKYEDYRSTLNDVLLKKS